MGKNGWLHLDHAIEEVSNNILSEMLFAFRCLSWYITEKYEGYWNIFSFIAFHCILW